jgi:IMP dehydrogenase
MRVLDRPSRSLRELRLLPALTPADGGLSSTSLETPLCLSAGQDAIRLARPFVSAAMQAVTGADMAVAIAQLGGIGVVPVSQTVEAQCRTVAAVKRFKAGFQQDILTLAPSQTLREAAALMERTGHTRFPVTDTGIFHGRLLGVLTDNDFDPRSDLDFHVVDRMRKDVQVGVEIDDLNEANRLMVETGRGFLPIVSQEGTLLSVVFKKDRDKHLRHPAETVDTNRRLRVAAAVSTHPEDRQRVPALLEHGADLLVIDASDGHTVFQADTIAAIKATGDVPVIAGNVVTASGFAHLAEAGADAVKVGMGVGSGCITQEMKATGRGQATAIQEVAEARDRFADRTGRRLPLIADGGIGGPAEIVVALALGADCVMLGNLLARFSESPGRIVRGAHGGDVKEYWMEGSRRAANARRYAQTREGFFEEGIEGWVPHEGSIYDGLPVLAQALRSALSTAGCRSIAELQERAVLEPQSEASLAVAAVRGMERSGVPIGAPTGAQIGAPVRAPA